MFGSLFSIASNRKNTRLNIYIFFFLQFLRTCNFNYCFSFYFCVFLSRFYDRRPIRRNVFYDVNYICTNVSQELKIRKPLNSQILAKIWFDFCFTALQNILDHFGRCQLPLSQGKPPRQCTFFCQ